MADAIDAGTIYRDGGNKMGPQIASGLISGGAGLVGNVIGGIMGRKSQQRQMDFAERMSSTAHQREVADLRAAGLNPILSANTGASSPSGSGMEIPDFGKTAQEGMSTALQAKDIHQRKGLIESQRTQMAYQMENLATSTQLLNKEIETEVQNARTKEAEADAKRVVADFLKKNPNWTQYISALAPILGPVSNIAGQAAGSALRRPTQVKNIMVP